MLTTDMLPMIEGSFEVPLPTLESGKSRRKEEKKREDQIRDRLKRTRWKQATAGAKNVEQLRFTTFFPMICGSGESKSSLATAVGSEM